MAYIGQQGGVTATITSKTLDTMTGDGSDTTLTLSQTPTSAEDVSIYADGVYQRPTNEYTVSGDVVTFTTAPASGVFVCAVTGGGHHIGSPMGGSVTTSKIIDGTITNAMVATMSSSKLTGALGALDGSALTGLPSTITKNASDPATDTNPSGGVGTVWANTTDGEMFVCTDATTDENVWYNVGGGDGDVQPFHGWGTISGFTCGGQQSPPSGSYQNVIDKHSFTADGNSTDHADLSASRQNPGGASSTTHGYVQGGYSAPTIHTRIDKFPFASQTNASNIANLTQGRYGQSGSSSTTHMYAVGGTDNSSYLDTVDKSTFSSDADSTDVGNLISGTEGCAGGNSNTHLYASGGIAAGNTYETRIEKISYASDTNGISVGNLGIGRVYVVGISSSTTGYVAGGATSSVKVNTIDRFSFASDGDATDSSDLTVARDNMAGTSSTISGYMAGGNTGSTTNVIDKFVFSTNANAIDVGDLTVTRRSASGSQY